VAIAMIGTRLRGITIAFMGWFGPRGLASVVFTLIVIEELGADGSVHPLVVIATWTIFLSVLLHGFSATPLAARYGAAIRRSDPDIPELAPAQEPRIRLRDLAGRRHLHHGRGGAEHPGS
jgi:NhaP-type Na+/H+ or K+/H+ antiporter